MDEKHGWTGTSTMGEVPIWHKQNLSVNEAVTYSGIGENRLRELIAQHGDKFALRAGKKILVKRKAFDAFIETRKYV